MNKKNLFISFALMTMGLGPSLHAPAQGLQQGPRQGSNPQAPPAARAPRKHMLFDSGWKFTRSDPGEGYSLALDDQHWREVSLPHDWSIEDLPARMPGDSLIGKDGVIGKDGAAGKGSVTGQDSIAGPFQKSSIGNTATGYTVGGTGWYRKHFTLSGTGSRVVSVCFDGVYMNSDVWINEVHLGNHPYGYTTFSYDLTPYLKPAGQENLIAVRVRNEGRNSRWYSGSGIYRHVWLDVSGPIHIRPWGVSITTPAVTATQASVLVRTQIVDESFALHTPSPIRPPGSHTAPLTVTIHIFDPHGEPVAGSETIVAMQGSAATQGSDAMRGSSDAMDGDAARGSAAGQTLEIDRPFLWSPEQPSLYRAVVSVYRSDKLVDQVSTRFGIRSIAFSADSGFLLNGKRTLLRGGCVHHDDGLLGSAVVDRAEDRKVELLKAAGYNAIRTSHNPPSPRFLDACDRLGMLVIDEAFDQWERGKNPQDEHLYFDQWWKKDIDAMVLRDRNHPSVIFWSIGNEIPERADSSGLVITKQLTDEVRRQDPTRPVTEAICAFWDRPGYTWDRSAPAFALLDVGGYNYMMAQYESDHAKYPARVMMGTETFPMEAWENWQKAKTLPYVIGDFVWTAMDYLGETGIGHSGLYAGKDATAKAQNEFAKPWPWFNAWCGDIDLIGNRKPQSLYRDILWGQRNMAMLVHSPLPQGYQEGVSLWGWPDEYPTWTFPGHEGDSLNVNVYTKYPTVRLLLNGKPVAEASLAPASRLTASFRVAYRSGELKAIGIRDGLAVDSILLRTAGRADHIRLRADRTRIGASANDLCYVQVEILDEKGAIVPDAAVPIRCFVSGNGKIAAAGNANPTDPHSFQQPLTNTFRGKALVILRPTGTAGSISLQAEAPGLGTGKITIVTEPEGHTID